MPTNLEDDDAVAVAVRRADGSVHGDIGQTARPVFSVTKMFVATAAMRLVESGRLALDAQLSDHSPVAPTDLTLREALSHTGGLPDYAMTTDYRAAVDARPGEPWEVAEVVAVGLSAPRSARGAFRYSNLGYWLAGTVLEAVAGTSLTNLLSDLVFATAGMVDTSYPEVGAGITADGYDTRWAGPAGAAWSTPTDLLAFLDALVGGALVSPASLATMTSATPVNAGPGPWRRPAYGLGLMTDGGTDDARRPDLTLGHGGGGPGYRSAAFVAQATGCAAAVMVRDTSTVDPTELALSLLRAPADQPAAYQWTRLS